MYISKFVGFYLVLLVALSLDAGSRERTLMLQRTMMYSIVYTSVECLYILSSLRANIMVG